MFLLLNYVAHCNSWQVNLGTTGRLAPKPAATSRAIVAMRNMLGRRLSADLHWAECRPRARRRPAPAARMPRRSAFDRQAAGCQASRLPGGVQAQSLAACIGANAVGRRPTALALGGWV